MIEGLFLVLEGIDGAGTTTHTKVLADALKKRGLPVLTTREPSDGPVGVLIRQFLTGRIILPGIQGPCGPSPASMALLFAADRLDHVDSTVLHNLRDGVTVISDRYYHSSVAYQSLAAGGGADKIEWIKTLNQKARRPDLTIVLDIPDAISYARVQSRSNQRDLYEDPELQRELSQFYSTIDTHFAGENIVHVDSNRPMAEVAADILQAVMRVRGEA